MLPRNMVPIEPISASSFRDMEAYGRKLRARLARFLPMAGGVPSHDTFGRVLSKLPPESLVHGLGVWLRAIAGRTDGRET